MKSLFCKISVVLMSLVNLCPIVSLAQQGSNAVWGQGQNGPQQQASSAFIDASAFGGNDICQQIYNVLTANGYPATGAVIDARGITQQASLNCTSGTPWVQGQGQNYTTKPSTILLPLATIDILSTWVLPDHTRLVGPVTTGSKAHGTTTNAVLQADPTSFVAVGDGSNTIIEMGSANLCPNGCTGISVEHITVDAKSNAVNTIYNGYAGDQSYVGDVSLINTNRTALYIATTASAYASNSGPYSNINVNSNGNVTSCLGGVCPACVRLQVQTRGVHGLTCTGQTYTGMSNGSGPQIAGIYADAGNNSIQDVHIESFTDGIEVGHKSGGFVSSVVISNVDGAVKGCAASMKNLIHICGPNNPSGRQACPSQGTVSDITIFDAWLKNGSTPATIQDDLTATAIPGQPMTVGSYVVGEQVEGTGPGYSRITSGGSGSTDTQTATWGSGTSAVGGNQCTRKGAIYSNENGQGGTTLYLCGSDGTWHPIA